MAELVDVAYHKQDNNDRRQNPAQIEAQGGMKLQTDALIGLVVEAVPAPAAAESAEQGEQQGSERQKVVADEEVLEIEYGRSLSERFERGENVETESTGQSLQNRKENESYYTCA